MRTSSWQVSDDVVWAGEDTVRLYHVGTGEFRSLNPTGSAIWCLLAEGASTAQIASELTEKLAGGNPAALTMITEDVGLFLAELADQQIVVPRDPALAGPGTTGQHRG